MLQQPNDPALPPPFRGIHPEMLATARAYRLAISQMRVGFAVVITAHLLYLSLAIWSSSTNSAVFGTTTTFFGAGYFGFTVGRRTATSDWLLSLRRATDTPWLGHLSMRKWAQALVDGSWARRDMAVGAQGVHRDERGPVQP